MHTPFRLIPWDIPFLEHLRHEVLRVTQAAFCDTHSSTEADDAPQPGNAVVVFPHNRPKRYFLPLFHTPGKACLPPRLFTVTELMTALRHAATPHAVACREASLPDQVAILHAATLKLLDTDPLFRERLGELTRLSEARFFPWGVRLAGIFEECLNGGLTPADLIHTEGEVPDFAAALLGALGRLFQLYREHLEAHALTTPGMDAFAATETLENLHELPDFLRGRQVILAGFNALNGTENRLFRFLWHHGATICLHGHPDLTTGKRPAGCRPLADWMQSWQADCELVVPSSGQQPTIHFFAGHDLHSQIAALREDLDTVPGLFTETPSAEAPPDNTPEPDQAPTLAVALTHADALLPTLHHLPAKNCNVSVGYPLDRSLLSGFILAVLQLRSSRTERLDAMQDTAASPEIADMANLAPTVHWRAWSTLLRHPCLRMLEGENADSSELRQALHALEHETRQGGRFLNPHDLLPSVKATVSAPTAAILDDILFHTLDAWAAVRTTAELAEALGGLCQLLVERGAHLWPRFPLDAECLFRLMRKIVPALRQNLLANRPLPWSLLESMLTGLMEAERVPFEADPLTGVQVLGMLETRLLHFDRVYVLDATEAHLPGPPDRNPLLPDSLRSVLGLPGSQQREELAAYTFHRLLAGAREVYLYWQEDEATSQRSRLVEERIWREEQRLGRLLKAGEAPLRAPHLRVSPPSKCLRPVRRTPSINARMDAFMERPLSPTTLDAYLTCPLRFYYERLCRVSPADEVNEGDDAPEVGILLHATLCEFYAPHCGRVYRPAVDDEARLVQLFTEKLHLSGLQETLPPESAAMLRAAGPERLLRYLRNQQEHHAEPLILQLETKMLAKFPLRNRDFTLTGTLDRVDARTEAHPADPDAPIRQIHVLDYKTGAVRLPAASLWEDTDFFAELAAIVHSPLPPMAEDDWLHRLALRVPSLQLPFYLALYHGSTGQEAHNAACVQLAEHGEEMPLFPESMTEVARTTARTVMVPVLLGAVLRHMAECDAFLPREGRHCDWCSVNKLCSI